MLDQSRIKNGREQCSILHQENNIIKFQCPEMKISSVTVAFDHRKFYSVNLKKNSRLEQLDVNWSQGKKEHKKTTSIILYCCYIILKS